MLFDSYMENARRTSRIFRDRPQSALDTAIFWTEYVIRHGGAPHLQSAAVKLAWHQYLLLDVITLMLGSVLIFLLAVRKLFRVLLSSKQVSKKNYKQQWFNEFCCCHENMNCLCDLFIKVIVLINMLSVFFCCLSMTHRGAVLQGYRSNIFDSYFPNKKLALWA